MEECNYILNGDDFAVVMFGCGIGYFLSGFLIMKYFCSLNDQGDQDIPILAQEVQ